MATNIAMVLAKDAGKKPRELAEAYAKKLARRRFGEKVDIAGPGFINLTLKPAAWVDALRAASSSAGLWQERHRAWCAGQRRICLGKSDRDRCMSVTAAAPCSAMRWRICSPSPASSDARILRQRCRRAGRCARALGYLRYREALGETSAGFPRGFIPATISSRLEPHSPPSLAMRWQSSRS
jgi:arginyl-tRNA synthetase